MKWECLAERLTGRRVAFSAQPEGDKFVALRSGKVHEVNQAAVSLALLADQAKRQTKRYRDDINMIQNDQELKVARDRTSYLLDLLARLRVGSRPEELALVSGGYRTEVERMQREILDYLTQPAAQTAKAG